VSVTRTSWTCSKRMDALGPDLVMFGGLFPDVQGTSTAPLFITGQSWSHAGMPDNAFYKFATSSLAWEATQCVGTAPSPRC
jgi:hypothetical protein